MFRKDAPKFNKYEDDFGKWASKMKLHLSRNADNVVDYITNEYAQPFGTLSEAQKKEKLIHNSMMIEFASVVHNYECVDIQDLPSAKQMWDKVVKVHGGDEHVLQAKVEGLK